jgi:hypothetical protein
MTITVPTDKGGREGIEGSAEVHGMNPFLCFGGCEHVSARLRGNCASADRSVAARGNLLFQATVFLDPLVMPVVPPNRSLCETFLCRRWRNSNYFR